MAAVTTILMGVGLGLSAAGMAIQYKGNQKVAEAQEKAEKAREKAMNLDALRRKRAVVRDMQMARSTALANATAQGASEGSGLQGGYGQISGQANTNIAGITENQKLGADVFAANRQQARGQTQAAFGGAITSVGGMVLDRRQEISRVGASLFA